MSKKENFLSTLKWGFLLWLFGYVFGILFFSILPKDQIGYFIMPLGLALMIWVLFKKIEREKFGCYFGLALIWTAMAALLDYLFIVKLFGSVDYYKTDVYVYYALTFIVPIAAGAYKFRKTLVVKN